MKTRRTCGLALLSVTVSAAPAAEDHELETLGILLGYLLCVITFREMMTLVFDESDDDGAPM